MNSPEVERLAKLFKDQDIAATIDEHNVVNISVGPIRVWITARPWYCDRGRWQVNAESDSYKLTIDWADGFPRYYFVDNCTVQEVAAWLEVRVAKMEAKYGTEDEP